ncbi:hypothetical protein N7481_006939 [Penicillium waksmanii]|uniref:uncharacterized protein n=1 Tax=Penicillium waksmanii TaxID=69791 RepID=UPI002548A9BA|nr:uncharacterized protein N7481_006939 [Penicillium waksmanii]KAJ5979641.1 hypothetical protein N7481_006939 [Penicillium waksmanii]
MFSAEKGTDASSNDSDSDNYFTDPPEDLEDLTSRYSGETAIQDETQQPSPRVRFRSTGGLLQNAPRRHAEAEQDRSQREGLPHRPTAPYAHGSEDIADTPLRERAPQAGQNQNQDTGARKEKVEGPAPEPKPPGAPQTTRNRIQSTADKLKGRARIWAERMGRSPNGGDDLYSGVYHSDWATGGQPPVSDVTDNKHKSEEEKRQDQAESSSEAHRLVRDLTQDHSAKRRKMRPKPYPHGGNDFIGGEDEYSQDEGLRYRSGGGGILSQLIKLNGGGQDGGDRSRTNSQTSVSSVDSKSRGQGSTAGTPSQPAAGTTTPKREPVKWYKRPPNSSQSILSGKNVSLSGATTPVSNEVISAAEKRRGKQSDRKVRLEDEIRVTVHIAEIICRQRYIMQLCRALMSFGAPTHRLEEYMQMTAKVLEVDSQFLYLPGCMIMSFDDPSTRTTEMKLVRVAQGVDLARLSDTHLIYKNVIHDVIGIEEAVQDLDDVMSKKPRYPKYIIVFVYGVATATVGPFAFNARPIDMPIIFINGLLVGLMQHVAAPRSALYSNVFEVTSTVVTSFLARAFGSIPKAIVDGKRQYLFCFSAISQASIALILPGFLVLCSSLELQSHQIIAGSIRMVYAIIFSLFLGYGITVGTTIYGLMDKGAVSDITCPKDGAFSNPYVQRFPFVAIMTVWLLIINQGKWKQLPPMTIIALSGYTTNYFSTKRLGSNSQVANTVGAFTIGIMGNLYSRLWHGHAATAILPGIFILVPSGLAATGTLISGVQSADEIRQNVSSHEAASTAPGAGLASASSVFSLGFGMIQVAIGITIGLFIAALIVYPYGKRRSGLFSF